MTSPVFWRCFHCGATFTRQQEQHARQHFGRDEMAEPVCLIRTAGEDALLGALRKAEDELVGYRAEDQEILRAMWSMQSDHRQALLREEQKGYDRGLADGRAELPSGPLALPFTLDEVRALLTRSIGADSLHGWCSHNDVHYSHAVDFRGGKRGPASDLLKALGLEPCIVRPAAPTTETREAAE